MAPQVGSPRAVTRIGLVPWHRLEMAGVHEEHCDPPCPQIAHGLPRDPGALKGDVGTACVCPPHHQREHILGPRGKGTARLLPMGQATRDDRLRMDVKTTAYILPHLHRTLLLPTA